MSLEKAWNKLITFLYRIRRYRETLARFWRNKMRNPYLYLALTGVLLSGCFRKPPQPETALFRDFSLASVVEGMKVPELQSLSGGGGGSESLGDIVRRRRDSHATYKITEREGKFDETRFISQLKREVDKVIGASGVRLDGSGSDNDNFHLDYSDQGHTGSLEVFGTRTEGNQFKLWSVMRENTQNVKK